MIRRLLLTVAILMAAASGTAHALGKWVLVDEGTSNFWDFSVGKGQFCWVDYSGPPNYYVGSTACATGSPEGGPVNHTSDFSQGGAFPNGHAQRIAVGESGGLKPQLFVTTAEGYLWVYEKPSLTAPFLQWVRWNQLPSALPTGIGGYGVSRLVYEAVDFYTGSAAQNPLWMLGKNNHVYRLIGTGSKATWQDASVAYAIGPIAQLSYSAMYEAVIVTWSDGTMAYYDDNADGFFYISPSATYPMAIDSSYTLYFGAGYYGTGGLFQAWCNTRAADQSCQFHFNVGAGSWYDLDSLPTIGGYPQIISDDINEAYPTAANAHSPDQEIPINIAEGRFMQLSTAYGGGPADTSSDYSDLIWVQTNALRVYVYEIWLFENR